MQSEDRWRAPTKPFREGELRCKAWSALLPPAVPQDDPLWRARCKQYWERQERIFGVRLSPFTMVLNESEGVVATYAVVLDILPGERVADRSFMPDAVKAYDARRVT